MGQYDRADDGRGQAAEAVAALNGTKLTPSPSIGTGFDQIDAADVGGQLVDGAFGAGDWLLHHGGQLVLDGAGFIPGVNVLTEGIQSGYHALHAGWDAHEGNTDGAKTELGEAAWHGGLALLNVLTGEGGKAAEGASAGAHGVEAAATVAGHGNAEFALHALHVLADTSEVAWDLTATMAQLMSGDDEKVPFLGGLVPWLAGGAGRNEEHSRGSE